MNCERCEEVHLLGLTGEADSEELYEARRHAAECPGCRDATARDEEIWREIGDWSTPAVPVDAASRLRTLLALESGRRRRPSTGGWAALAAAALAGVFLGVAVASRPSPPLDASGRGPGYLLLLRRGPAAVEPPSGPELDRMIARYSDWREALERRGELRLSRLLDAASGIELSAVGGRVAAERIVPRDRNEYVSGLFLVEAADLAAAEAIARSSPHLAYGGTIEVRPIVIAPRKAEP